MDNVNITLNLMEYSIWKCYIWKSYVHEGEVGEILN